MSFGGTSLRVLVVLTCVLTTFSIGEAQAAPSTMPTWGHARIVDRDGDSIFEVDGKPFFLYGAAFFYERLPRDMWSDSMAQLKAIGINTLDLYVPWNWHELSDGDFDFTGRTSPRRDFDEVLRLASTMDFKIVLRPGPVIRNEWRNGGYPAWLLSRPEYGMPLHDLLEGRYPPTATLQNQHSDDAAAQWMRNATHVRYARRWLERVLNEASPYADRIVAIALDDDQGAYLDNQTYPAPHFQAYIGWLRDVVHGVTGNDELTFINTYQMKVPATSPVWAMGNWYQSDAYSIGEHDLSQLEFSTSLLHTRPHQPMFASEFQAGWLEQADDARPRPADPSNTILAMATMLGLGVRGIVNFPAQDTLNPPGWEAPWANVFYAWDAAVPLGGTHFFDRSSRLDPTAQFGAMVTTFGPELAAARQRYDAAIVYPGGSVKPALATNAVFAAIASATIDAQKACRDANLACTLVDPSAVRESDLAQYPVLVVPHLDLKTPIFAAGFARTLAAYRSSGGIVVRDSASADAIATALRAAHREPLVTGIPGGRFLGTPSERLDGFLIVSNFTDEPLEIDHGSVTGESGRRFVLPPFTVAQHDAIVVPVGLQLHAYADGFDPSDRLTMWACKVEGVDLDFHGGLALSGRDACSTFIEHAGGPPLRYLEYIDAFASATIAPSPSGPSVGHLHVDYRIPTPAPGIRVRNDVDLPAPTFEPVAAGNVAAYARDVYRDGSTSEVLDNGLVRLIVSPQAGGRAFSFMDDITGDNVFTTVGALRDDVAIEPPLSTVDKIAKYTHDFPAGTFNRTYSDVLSTSERGASVALAYAAPDVVPSGARFEKTVTLEPGARAFELSESVAFNGPASGQRAVSVSSLAVDNPGPDSVQRVYAPSAIAFAPNSPYHVPYGNAIGYYAFLAPFRKSDLATVAWRAGDIEDATIVIKPYSVIVRLTLARGKTAHIHYGLESAANEDEAKRLVAKADADAQRNP